MPSKSTREREVVRRPPLRRARSRPACALQLVSERSPRCRISARTALGWNSSVRRHSCAMVASTRTTGSLPMSAGAEIGLQSPDRDEHCDRPRCRSMRDSTVWRFRPHDLPDPTGADAASPHIARRFPKAGWRRSRAPHGRLPPAKHGMISRTAPLARQAGVPRKSRPWAAPGGVSGEAAVNGTSGQHASVLPREREPTRRGGGSSDSRPTRTRLPYPPAGCAAARLRAAAGFARRAEQSKAGRARARHAGEPASRLRSAIQHARDHRLKLYRRGFEVVASSARNAVSVPARVGTAPSGSAVRGSRPVRGRAPQTRPWSRPRHPD